MSKEENGDLTPEVKHMAPAIGMVDESTRDPLKDLISTRNVRAAINNALTGKGLPVGDPEMLNIVLKNLKDMDAASLGQMRIAIEEKANDTAEEMKELAAASLAYLFDKKSEGVKATTVGEVNSEPPSISDDEIDPLEFIPGETKVGTVVDNFESFSSRVGGVALSDTEEADELS